MLKNKLTIEENYAGVENNFVQHKAKNDKDELCQDNEDATKFTVV